MKKIFALLFITLFLVSCSSQTEDIKTKDNTSQSMKIEELGSQFVVETNKGSFTIQLYQDTPITTHNFLALVEEGFYNGLTFHRYEPGFVIQGGDPKGDGSGGSEQMIELEIAEGRSHTRGTLGMARSNDPNSASSQFFDNLAENTFLDGNYAVFGEVTEGMDVVDTLRAGDRILSLEIV